MLLLALVSIIAIGSLFLRQDPGQSRIAIRVRRDDDQRPFR